MLAVLLASAVSIYEDMNSSPESESLHDSFEENYHQIHTETDTKKERSSK